MKVLFGKHNHKFTGEIYDGTCVTQEFTAQTAKLLSVNIYFATYRRENEGTIIVDVRDISNKTIAEGRVDAARLEDNSFREFGLGAKLIPGHRYRMRIWTSHCRSGQSATACYGRQEAGGPLFMGAKLIRHGELYCEFNYEKDEEPEPEILLDPKPEELGEAPPIPEGAIAGLVSVVIPHYNCLELLPKCLNSIANQTYSCLEVIVIDDGSDNQPAFANIIKTFEDIIPSLSFKMLPKNAGAPTARNVGAEMARGEYLFFCDADVLLYAESIETLVRCLLENPEVDFSYGGFIWGTRRIPPVAFDVGRLKRGNFVTTMSLMRRTKFPGWDESLQRFQDWDMWLTIVENGSVGICCDAYLFESSIKEGSISSGENCQEFENIVKSKHASKAEGSTFTGQGDGLISVVVPCYNDELFLPKLLGSIEKQTYNHCSVVVVDDCSDNGQAVQDACDSCDLPVSYKRNSSQLGASESRNIGLADMSSEFVFFCDSDVILSPECFQEHIQVLHENLDCAWSYSNFSVGEEKRSFYPFNVNAMYSRNCSSTMSMIRSSVEPSFNPRLRRLQDWDMFLTLTEKGHMGCWIDEFLFFAHDKPGITKSSITWEEAVKEMMKYHES